MKRLGLLGVILLGFFSSVTYAAMPATTTYKLNSYGFGSGGTANSSTSTYALEGITGEISGQTASTSTYSTLPGFVQTQQANVPKVTLTNPSNYYDKLKIVIDNQSNPTDALFAVQISTTSDFSSNVKYVKSDSTIGSTLVTGDYRIYSAFGSGSGINIIGLPSSTTYYARAKATQGKFTESAYGPSSNAATVGQQFSFCLYSNANCGAGGSSEAFSGLTAGNITNSPTNIGVDFATNANSGGRVYIYSANGGLKSTSASYTITSATANLAVTPEGFGAQIVSATQSTGGPLTKVSPYDLSANNVGILATTVNEILKSLNPLTGGTAAIQLQVKPSNTTRAATDYSETLTVIAAAIF
jgi:predicted secreted protein